MISYMIDRTSDIYKCWILLQNNKLNVCTVSRKRNRPLIKSMMRVTSLKASSTSSRNKLLQDQANSVITSSRALPIDPHASPLPSSRRQTYIHSILIYPRLSTTSRASRVFHIYREADVESNSEWLPPWFSYRCFTVEKLIRLSERVILFTRTVRIGRRRQRLITE